MNLSNIDMKQEFVYYNQVAPVKTVKISGRDFSYRYYQNPKPEANATIVMWKADTLP